MDPNTEFKKVILIVWIFLTWTWIPSQK
jgi:hypothetical protein